MTAILGKILKSKPSSLDAPEFLSMETLDKTASPTQTLKGQRSEFKAEQASPSNYHLEDIWKKE